jgi:hypothetical protein
MLLNICEGASYLEQEDLEKKNPVFDKIPRYEDVSSVLKQEYSNFTMAA